MEYCTQYDDAPCRLRSVPLLRDGVDRVGRQRNLTGGRVMRRVPSAPSLTPSLATFTTPELPPPPLLDSAWDKYSTTRSSSATWPASLPSTHSFEIPHSLWEHVAPVHSLPLPESSIPHARQSTTPSLPPAAQTTDQFQPKIACRSTSRPSRRPSQPSRPSLRPSTTSRVQIRCDCPRIATQRSATSRPAAIAQHDTRNSTSNARRTGFRVSLRSLQLQLAAQGSASSH